MIEHTQAKILLVDDRPDKLLALAAVLEDMGTTIVTANSGRDALRLLLKDEYALILLDVSMPDIDGFETAALIRQRKQTEHTPIIFITSINTNETHVSRGYSLGAVDYIFSPIQADILRAKAGVFIDLFNKTHQVKRQEELLRQQAERKLTSLESRLERLLDKLSVGVCRLTMEGELIEANPAFLRLLGFDSIEEGRSVDLTFLRMKNVVGKNERSQPQEQDYEWKKKNGETVWFVVSQTVSSDAEGNFYIEGVLDDISARKNVELQLKALNENLEQKVIERTEALAQSQQIARRSERLASLGTLAAGIAHEINNPLNSILMATDFALRHIKEEKKLSETLHIISHEVRRCGKIVKGVLQFSRDEKRPKTAFDLNTIVQNAVELARTYVNSPLTINLDLSFEPLNAMLNPTEIEQIVVNLIQNAVEASINDTEVTIATLHNSNRAILRVTDNGVGIPEDMQMKIFDPFYSTKTEKGGTGLGLSVVHGIVGEHGGSIRIVSKPGEGACFEVEFPLIDDLEGVVSTHTKVQVPNSELKAH